jgi:nucleoside-diphosphate-sugar epimerase
MAGARQHKARHDDQRPDMSLPEAVIVAGASGFIGRNIVDALRGETGLLIGVNSNGAPVAGCDRTVALNGLAKLGALPNRTAIVHVAAMRYAASRFADDQAAIVAANMALTNTLYGFAVARGITEVRAASSSAVYPASWTLLDDARPLDFNDWPHDGEAAYAWSKRWGELAAELWRRRAGVHTISFRLTNPYGKYDTLDETDAHVATAFVIRALGQSAEFEIRGDPEAERDFVYAGDVAAAFVASLRLEGISTAVNLAQGRTTTVRELALAAMAGADRSRPLRARSSPHSANPGVRIRRATATKFRELLPDLPAFRTLGLGLHETIQWYRDALRR